MRFILYIVFFAFLLQSAAPLLKLGDKSAFSTVLTDDAADEEEESSHASKDDLGKEQIFHHYPQGIVLHAVGYQGGAAQAEFEQSHYCSTLHAGLPELPPEPFA